MNSKQENKRSMYIAVKKVCNKNNSIWSGLPAFVSAFDDFEKIISEIEMQRLIQEGNTTGVTLNKQKEEDEMIQSSIEVAAAVYAYASFINDYELKEKVRYSPSYLQTSRDTILKDICQLIHDEADAVIANLPDYGKDAADLIHLQQEIDDFADILAQPRTAIGTRSTATSQLVELIKDADNVLKDRLDKLMAQYKNTQSKFYKSFHNARIIVDFGIRHKIEQETVLP